MSPLLARYHALPRATRWALWAGAALVAYFAVLDPVIATAADLHRRAGDKAARLVTLDREARTGQKQAEAQAAANFGLVAVPGNDPDGAGRKLETKVDEVLKKHGVTAFKRLPRTAPFSQGPLAKAVTSEERAERRISEVQFDAAPEVIAAIVADLERTPEVSAVSRVEMRRVEREGSSRQLHATVAAETWVIARKGRAR